jgi:hypothetical protein
VFDEYLVAAAHQLDAGGGDQPNTPLAGLQFTRDSYSHTMSSVEAGSAPARSI